MAGKSQLRRESRSRVDQPRQPRRGPNLPDYDPETLGKLSERFARFLGTFRFISYMSFFIVAWIVYNIVPGTPHFDEWGNKFTFLTLILSLQASYAAPLILLAQNRQADRDRVTLDEDRARNDRSIADTEYLTREVASIRIALGEVATRDFIRGELQRMLLEMDGMDERRAEDAEPESA
ncbi:DUF1003 domain-containing protein [Acidothermaceae bacterium B102]|nr:DUF1003 domain-containing protein [Acidothermaceae bacterium B102]